MHNGCVQRVHHRHCVCVTEIYYFLGDLNFFFINFKIKIIFYCIASYYKSLKSAFTMSTTKSIKQKWLIVGIDGIDWELLFGNRKPVKNSQIVVHFIDEYWWLSPVFFRFFLLFGTWKTTWRVQKMRVKVNFLRDFPLSLYLVI